LREPVVPPLPAEISRRHSALLAFIGRCVLRLTGWRVAGELPRVPRFVAIVAPHTSNWDFVIGVFVMFALDLRLVWLGKDSLFRTPLGPWLRAIGGRPVKRTTSEGAVAGIAATLLAEPRFILALAPEGTRRRVTQWRTGYYRIAEATGVPILAVAFDWGRRRIVLGEVLHPTGAIERDVARLQRFYRADMARFPANYGLPVSADAGA
jgi:1-acyl-sn-glycerol-3-phosphate acyltransferase